MTDATKNGEKTKGTGYSWWATRVVGSLFALFLGLILCGLLYQQIAMYQDQSQYPPPGDLIDVGGHQLHLYCLGTGNPTVVLEAGLGDNWLTWSLVQEKIAGITRVCAYDRAGLGWSDSAPGPRTSPVAESLHTLLNNAGIPGPYVLVGHSVGGIYVRSFAHQYPEDVVGMVLVDSSHENQLLRFPAEITKSELENTSGLTRSLALCRYLAPLGVVRLLGLMAGSTQDKPLPPEQRQMLIATLNRTNYCQAVASEWETEIQIASRQTRPLYKLGAIPLVVMTVPSDSSEKEPNNFSAGVTKEMAEQADKTFLELQQELAALSTQGTLVTVQDAGHYIQFDRPGLVVEAIRKVVASLK